MNITWFAAATTAAVVLQTLILLGMFLAVRKTNAKVEALADEVKNKILPTVDVVQATVVELRPKIENIVANVSETTTMTKAQLQRLDATISDVLDRTRLQIIRADELLSRTMDKVEDATDMVHDTVVSPVRQVSGLLQGVTAALQFLMGGKRRGMEDAVGTPHDEMFI